MRGPMVDRQVEQKGSAAAPAARMRGRALAAAVLAPVLLAACAGTQASVSSTIRPLTDATGFSTKVDPPKDFVKETRPANMDYMAVGITPPARKQTVLTPAELANATSQLEATRAAHDKLAGRKPPVPKVKVKKQGEKPASSL